MSDPRDDLSTSEQEEKDKMLDNLAWAKKFMHDFEEKEGRRAEINRNRQQKYF